MINIEWEKSPPKVPSIEKEETKPHKKSPQTIDQDKRTWEELVGD